MKIITGYTGEAHITSADDQAINRGLYAMLGTDELTILPIGSKFAATSANGGIRISDGVGIIRGVAFRVPPGAYDDVTIEPCSTGLKRWDVIRLVYQRSTSGVESLSWDVEQGTAAANPWQPTPEVIGGEPYEGALSLSVPMYLVRIEGAGNPHVYRRYYFTVPTFAELRAVVSQLTGRRVMVSEEVKSVTIPTLAPTGTTERITTAVTLPAGADFFDAVPLDGGRHLRVSNFSFNAEGFGFAAYNDGTSTIANGIYRVLVRYYKTIGGVQQ